MARIGNPIGTIQKRNGNVCWGIGYKVERLCLIYKCLYNMHIMSGDIICNGMTWFRADFHFRINLKKHFRIQRNLSSVGKQ